MKRLIIALVAAVAVSTGFAKITVQEGFEKDPTGFGIGTDATVETYDGAGLAALYPFDNGGSKYLALDAEDTVWCTNSSSATYFDMYMQFNPCMTEPDIGEGTKIAVYVNAETNLVVVSGSGTNTYSQLPANTWARLTIAQKSAGFDVYIDGEQVGTTFASLNGDATINEIGFAGSGSLDNFVARTTDPFLQNPAATIGGEGYASYTDALKEALADGGNPTVSYNGTTGNGTSSNPYKITCADDLKTLQELVAAYPAARSACYAQTANIDMTGVENFYGIGWFTSTDNYASLPAGVTNKQDIAFAGVYDGDGYTISNVTIVRHNYAGVFNNVSGTVKDLTVQDIGFSGTCGEWGCAIVGNAQGNAVLENLTATTSVGFNWGDSANHNVAGIVVRPVGATTIRGCVNNAAISATSKRLGGIAAFTGAASGNGIQFVNCTNNAALVSTDGTRGVGGILGCAEAGTSATATIISGCVDFGSETAQASGGHAGAIVGSNWNGTNTYTDGGGNTFKASTVDCGYVKNAVFGRVYAVASGDYLTTVKAADLAAGNTYTLLQNVAASETPVFTLSTGDTIAFDTALGYTFAGTIATANLYPVESSTSGTVTTYSLSSALFPRTATAGQDGSAANPYELADADDLQALAAFTDGYSLNYKQTADIDMASAGAFAGIGEYAKVPTSGTPFTGTYNGQGYTIANVTRAGGNTQGIFNQVGVGGVIENLVVSNMVADTGVTGYGFAIVGNAGGGATLRNLTAAGTFASADNPSGHNIAGIVVRVCGGATADVATTIDSCTNNATIYGGYTKLGGICAIAQQQTGFTAGKVVFNNCANNGTLVCKRTKAQAEEKDGAVTGNAGIVGYVAANNVELTGCYSNGNVINEDGANTDKDGALIGWQFTGYTLTDKGGNSAPAGKKMIAHYGNVANVTGFQYATVDNGVATTVTTLAAGNTYLLEGNVAAGTVYTLQSAGDTIAFNTALGYTFAGSVETAEGLLVTPTTADGVTTYTAAAVVATVGSEKFATLQAAIDAAVAGETKTVDLVGAATGAVNIPAGITVAVPQSLVTGTTFSGITSLVGPGTIRVAMAFPPNALCSLLMNSAWNGTLEIYNLNASGYPLYLTNYGNVNSTIRLNQILNATLSSDFQNFTGTLEVGALGWNVTGSFNEIVLPSKLTGAGAITVSTTPATGTTASTLRFTGDVSGFIGNISFGSGSNARVAFGSNKAGSASSIYVHQGSSVTNVGTWAATDVIVTGELVANGTVSGTLKCLNGYTGTYRANASTAAISADSSWTGTYVVGWNPGDSNTAFDINNYGTAATATIQIDGVDGEFAAFPRENGTVANVTAKIVLNANWSIGNGWSGVTNTFAYLTGSGNISVANVSGYSYGRIFNIKELDGYTGTLGGANGVFVVDKVNVAEPPDEGARVVKTAIGANGSIAGDLKLYVAGVESGTLEYKADGANGAGLYVKAEEPSDDWNTPATDADVATSLEEDGISTDSGAVTTVEEFNALVEYITNTVSGAVAPTDLSPNQKANAVLCYALNAASIPDAAITDSDITIDSVEQTGDAGAVALTVAIAGVTVGQTVDSTVLAKVVTAKGGTDLKSLSAENVDVSGHGAANGKVAITVTPKKVNPSDPAPTSFFTSVIINK